MKLLLYVFLSLRLDTHCFSYLSYISPNLCPGLSEIDGRQTPAESDSVGRAERDDRTLTSSVRSRYLQDLRICSSPLSQRGVGGI